MRCSRVAACRFHLDSEDHKDFAQEASLRLIRAIRKKGILPDGYVRVLVSNAITSARRSRLVSTTHEIVPDDMPKAPETDPEERQGLEPSDGYSEQDATDCTAIKQFVDTLSDKLGEVYQALYVDGLSHDEASCRLAVTRQRVTQLNGEMVQRGRKFFGLVAH
jgi:RNA polymerase sigma factor (sigma-70 family)